jgi:hypothetical protein
MIRVREYNAKPPYAHTQKLIKQEKKNVDTAKCSSVCGHTAYVMESSKPKVWAKDNLVVTWSLYIGCG